MNTLSERLKAARKHAGLTQKQLADKAGVEQPLISQLETGKNSQSVHLISLASACGVSATWLSNGLGPMLTGETSWAEPKIAAYLAREDHAGINVAGSRIEVRTRSVPVVGKAMLGVDGFFEEFGYPVGHGEGVLNVVSRDENAYGLRVVGHSMAPRIKHNEFVLIEPNHAYSAGDEVLVKTTKGQAMIKSFAYLRDGQYKFDSINAEYAPVILDQSEVLSIQYVGAIVKSSMFSTAD